MMRHALEVRGHEGREGSRLAAGGRPRTPVDSDEGAMGAEVSRGWLAPGEALGLASCPKGSRCAGCLCMRERLHVRMRMYVLDIYVYRCIDIYV